MTETTDAPNLKQIATEFQSGIRRLVSIAVSDSTSHKLPPVQRLKQEMADRDGDVASIRHRSLSLLAVKDDLTQLQKEVNEKRNQLKAAERAVAALAQQIGDAAFHSHLEGRTIDLKEIASRMGLHEQVEALQREKEELGKAPTGGMADKAKSFAQQATLSGRMVLLQQKTTSADKVLGTAVLQAGMEAEVLRKNSDELLLKIAEARKSISICAEALANAERQVTERQAMATADLGIKACDSAFLDAECNKCGDRLFEIESNRLKARWDCGGALLSLPSEQLSESLASVATTLKGLKSEHPDACNLPSIDKHLLTAELAAQVKYLYECIGTVVHEKSLFKDKLSTEFKSIDSAQGAKRKSALRRLGEATLKESDQRFADTYPSLQEMRSQIEAIDLTNKELGGSILVGTGGKTTRLSTAATVGTIGCLALLVLLCGGVLTAVVKDITKHARDRQSVASSTLTPKIDDGQMKRDQPNQQPPVAHLPNAAPTTASPIPIKAALKPPASTEEAVAKNDEESTDRSPALFANAFYLGMPLDEFSIIALVLKTPAPEVREKVVDGKRMRILDFGIVQCIFGLNDSNQYALLFLMTKDDGKAKLPPVPGASSNALAQRKSAYERGKTAGRNAVEGSVGEMVRTIGGQVNAGDPTSEAVIRVAKDDFQVWKRKVLEHVANGQSDFLTEYAGFCVSYAEGCKAYGINVFN